MKNLMRVFAIWLLNISKDNKPYTGNKYCKVINDGRFLVVTMPNGDVIPCQTDLQINNSMSDRHTCRVKIEFTVPINNII